MLRSRLPLYLRPRVLLMFALGFGSGLPLLLTGSTLLAWLTAAGVRTGALGLYTLVGLPYSLKLLWAPLVDQVAPLGRLGRRRGWMLITQLLLGAALVALGCSEPARAPLATAALAVLVALLSATQDIAVDAYRTDLLPPELAAAGTATFVFGYRVAMIVAGALALRLADVIGGSGAFSRVYFVMAAALLPAIAATLLAPVEPAVAAARPRALLQAYAAPLVDFFRRREALTVLAFVMLYRLSDVLTASLITPFLLQSGYTNTEVAHAAKLVGLLASILGALLGGAMVQRAGLGRPLYVFGFLQASSNLGYVALAHRHAVAASQAAAHSMPLLYAAVATENLCNGLAVAGLGAFLIGQCNRRYSATQAALLSSASGVVGRLLAGGSGFVVERWGWTRFLLACVVAGLPALLLLWRLQRKGAMTVRPSTASLTPDAEPLM